MRGKGILTIVISVAIALIFCMPGQIMANEEVPETMAPVLPFELSGYAYIDGVPVNSDYTLMTIINDTVFGTDIPLSDGQFYIKTYGDHTDTPEFREGGGNGDVVYYMLKKNDGVPGRKWYCADETFIFVSGGWVNTDLHFSSTGSPWPMKIASVTPNPSSGNDIISLYNPSNETVSLDDWKLRDRDGWEMPLSGIIAPESEKIIDLGGDVLSNAVDGGPSSGDEISLCWQDPLGVMGAGDWVPLDQVEYGNQNDYWDNTTLLDYPTSPAEGLRIARTPQPYSDNDDCATDFIIELAPVFTSIPLEIGWNLISLPIIPDNITVESVLSSISGSYDCVKAYDAFDSADHWKSYSPNKSWSVNDLYVIDNTMGFWISALAPCLLQVEGTEPVTTITNLKAGWNLVGYPSNATNTVTSALSGTGFDKPVEEFDMGATYLIHQKANSELMTSGNGYWVHVPSDTVWTLEYEMAPAIPFTVFGFVQLYDGTSAGGYNPMNSFGGATIDVEWYNPSIGGWDIIGVGCPAGTFSIDLPNTLDGGIVYLNATFDLPYGNKGYNYTYIDQMMGSTMQNVLCGIPYEIEFSGAPPMIPSGEPWWIDYDILDRDHMRARGYFTHVDGPMDLRSSDPFFEPPPQRIFDGTNDIMPGHGSEVVTLYTSGPQIIEVYEMIENTYLTPWYEFYIGPGSTTPGWNSDSAMCFPLVL